MSLGNVFMKRCETLSNEKIKEMCDITFHVGVITGLIAGCFAALGAVFFFTNPMFKYFIMSKECDFFDDMRFVILILCITSITSSCLYFLFHAVHKERWRKFIAEEQGTTESEPSIDETADENM